VTDHDYLLYQECLNYDLRHGTDTARRTLERWEAALLKGN
jgi:hypothetical protein